MPTEKTARTSAVIWRVIASAGCVSSFACSSTAPEPTDNLRDTPALPGQVAPKERAKEIIEPSGKRWVLNTASVVYATSDKPISNIDPQSERSIVDMSVDEVAVKERPKMLVGDTEYLLDEKQAYELAQEMKRIAIEEPDQDAPGAVATTQEGAELRQGRNVFNGESRSIFFDGVFPDNRSGRRGSGCTIFKWINHHTAATAAHCVHNGSNWLPRAVLQFAPASGAFATLPSNCYDMQVPGGWDGATTDYDRAIIRLRSSTANCNTPDYDAGFFGFTTVGGCTTGIACNLDGYPTKFDEGGQAPPGNWVYPTAFWDFRGDGWTSCGTFPTRLWHYADASDGNSGSPVYTAVAAGDYRVRGIHKGGHTGPFGSSNQARRVTSDLLTWYQSNAGF
jgi:V8-like Glu-specific endopeptidase